MDFQGENRSDNYQIEFVKNCFAGIDKIIENIENLKSPISNPKIIKVRHIIAEAACNVINKVLLFDQNGKFNKIKSFKLSNSFKTIFKNL
jgi:hypothetical protein